MRSPHARRSTLRAMSISWSTNCPAFDMKRSSHSTSRVIIGFDLSALFTAHYSCPLGTQSLFQVNNEPPSSVRRFSTEFIETKRWHGGAPRVRFISNSSQHIPCTYILCCRQLSLQRNSVASLRMASINRVIVSSKSAQFGSVFQPYSANWEDIKAERKPLPRDKMNWRIGFGRPWSGRCAGLTRTAVAMNQVVRCYNQINKNNWNGYCGSKTIERGVREAKREFKE